MPDSKIILLPLGTYVAGDFLAKVNGSNAPERVPLSAFEESGHDHDGLIVDSLHLEYPSTEILTIGDSVDRGMIRFYGAASSAYGPLKGGGALVGNTGALFWSADGRVSIHTADALTYGLRLTTGSDFGKALAYSWELHPCALALKEDVKQIPTALAKVGSATGITYKQDGVENTGIAAEDYEAMGLPGLVSKDDEGEYESINPLGLVPVLLEAIKELTARLEIVEARLEEEVVEP